MSSQQLSIPYCSWGSTQTPMSATSILQNNANSYDTKVFGKTSWKRAFQQDSSLEKRLYKLPERPLSKECTYLWWIVSNFKYPESNQLLQRISVTELLSGIDFVSRALENEKKENFSSLSDKCLDLQMQKKNVTHLEVFEASCDTRKHPSNREVLKAVVYIQRYVRGWLEHRAFKRVKIKSTSHGPSLTAVVRYYRKMIACIKCQAGVLDLSTPLWYFLEEWMDKKKFYETMFSKREFDKKMDRNDLPEFLRNCGYSIPASGIQCVFRLVCPGSGFLKTLYNGSQWRSLQRSTLIVEQRQQLLASTAAVRSIKKHQANEMTFTLFPPLGAKVKNIIIVPLPWVHSLMGGKDGSKKLGFSHQKSKKVAFQVSAALATSSMREGKENHLSD
ncbi:LOW QUALITY PROTEIN: IQ domain-containing protein M [Leptosomus discolor]